MIDAREIGNRLRQLRGKRTIAEVAKSAGIGASALTMYELGHRIPRDNAKMALAHYYNTSVEALFFTKGSSEE